MTNPHTAFSLTALLLALTLLIGPLVLSACGGNNASSSRRYPPDVERNFLDFCEESGADPSLCQCALSKIESQYTLQEMSRIEVKMAANDDLPQKVLDDVANCRMGM